MTTAYIIYACLSLIILANQRSLWLLRKHIKTVNNSFDEAMEGWNASIDSTNEANATATFAIKGMNEAVEELQRTSSRLDAALAALHHIEMSHSHADAIRIARSARYGTPILDGEPPKLIK